MRVALLILVGCSSASTPRPAHVDAAIEGHLAEGRTVSVAVAHERIDGVTDVSTASSWLWAPIVDSHVHLAFWPVADQLAAAGVEGVVDLAAPERALGAASPIHVISSGPMITHDGGYPLDAWGADGFGIGCRDAACATATVARLKAHRASLVKIAGDDDGLDPALYGPVVAAAHARGMKVAIHALTDASAARAAQAGVDILAHTPVEALRPSTIAAWRGRAVISTLAAFGGSATAVANLRALRTAGALVLYGTDLGNLRVAGPSAEEVRLLAEAGLDDAAIVAAMTTAPAAYWGLPFGMIASGREATFLVLDRDPRRDVQALFAPTAIYVRGERVSR